MENVNDIKKGEYIRYTKNGKSGEGKVYEYFSTGELRVNGLLVKFLDTVEKI
jgi:hypothetical protein